MNAQSRTARAVPATARAVFYLLASLAVAGLASAATREWVAQAGDMPQIDSITVAGTWAAGDTGSITIGNSTLTVTCGSDTTTTSVIATVIKEAINATTIDSNLVGAEQRTAAGQLLGEFRDVVASIDTGNSSRVLVRSKVAGVPFYDVADVAAPFTLSASETTAGSGTLTAASVQVATGKNWWNKATNWSGGVVPANGDTIVVANSSVPIMYGMPKTADLLAPAALDIDQSFTGRLGLPIYNAIGYAEYRERTPDLRDDGTNSNTLTIRIGRGAGLGSPLINLKSTMVHANSTAFYHVYNTGKPQGTDYALTIDYNGNNTGADVNISGGSVHLKSVEVNDITINKSADQATVLFDNVSVIGGGGDVTINGGDVTYRSAANLTLVVYDGTIQFVGAVPATLYLYGGTAKVLNANSGTITTLLVGAKGRFDLSRCTTPITISTCDLFRGAALADPVAKGTYSAGIDLNRCDVNDVEIQVGTHRRLTLGAAN